MKPAVDISSPYFLFRDPFRNRWESEIKKNIIHSKDQYEFIIIEDEINIANVERINLLKVFKGCNIRIFTQASEGFDYLKHALSNKEKGNITILFLDLYMPEMTGFEILDRILQLTPDEEYLYVYVLSGSLNDRDIRKAINHQITDGFISKPLTIENIFEFFAFSDKFSER